MLPCVVRHGNARPSPTAASTALPPSSGFQPGNSMQLDAMERKPLWQSLTGALDPSRRRSERQPKNHSDIATRVTDFRNGFWKTPPQKKTPPPPQKNPPPSPPPPPWRGIISCDNVYHICTEDHRHYRLSPFDGRRDGHHHPATRLSRPPAPNLLSHRCDRCTSQSRGLGDNLHADSSNWARSGCLFQQS